MKDPLTGEKRIPSPKPRHVKKRIQAQLRLYKKALAQSRANYEALMGDYRELEARNTNQAFTISKMRERARAIVET